MPLTKTISDLIGLTPEEVYGPDHDANEDAPVKIFKVPAAVKALAAPYMELGGFSEVEPNPFLSTEEEPF